MGGADFTYNVEHFMAVNCDAVGQIDTLSSSMKQSIFIPVLFQGSAENTKG